MYFCFMKKGFWQQIAQYFYLKKRKSNDPRDANIFLMHGMNRISIFVFIIAFIIILYRLFSR